jgi:hypothetical protein
MGDVQAREDELLQKHRKERKELQGACLFLFLFIW